MQVTQAEFARQMNVSRKTVTTWKSEARIVMAGQKVDVEASHARLRQCASGKSKGYLAATENGKIPGNSFQSGAAGNALEPGEDPDVPAAVRALHDMATNSAQSMAIDLLKILPEATVRPIYDSLQSLWRGCASAWADELVAPPGGLDHWQQHPIFISAAPDVWAELRRDAGLRELDGK